MTVFSVFHNLVQAVKCSSGDEEYVSCIYLYSLPPESFTAFLCHVNDGTFQDFQHRLLNTFPTHILHMMSRVGTLDLVYLIQKHNTWKMLWTKFVFFSSCSPADSILILKVLINDQKNL